jgi:transcriptional regulator of acetoin/glycerol metabolism
MSPSGHVPAVDTTAIRSPVPSSGPVGAPVAIVFHGERAEGRGSAAHALDRPLTVGRGEDCDIALADASASRVHARLVPTSEGVEVVDLGSRNGTFVDGRPVVRTRLGETGLVRVGDTLLRICVLAEAWQPAESRGPLLGGTSVAPMRRMISLVGPTPLPVLILGETGTGKEVVARLLHAASGRPGPFIAVNCAALPESLVESELFGHVRGAFTDAGQGRKGLFSAASGGTLFLDEVGDLPPVAQAKLLRVLEDGLVRPIGAETARKVDVRIVSATNRDLGQAVSDKGFRSDLLARLSAVEMRPPRLAARPEDLPALVAYLLARAGHRPLRVAPDALEALALYDWPQNIRELDNVVRAAMLRGEAELGFAQLPERIQQVLHRARGKIASTQKVPLGDQRAQIEDALLVHRGNVRRASLALGIARSHLYRLMARWNLELDSFRAGAPHAPFVDDTTERDTAR